MSPLLQHFDRVVVISLPERADRRTRLLQNLSDCNLATSNDITWLEAVDGRKVTLPAWWKAGTGAWGCRFSQLKAIQEAQRDGLKNVLILEDDAVFHPRSTEWLDDIMPKIPSDWGQLFLGGQHMRPPLKTANPKVVEGRATTRTHAYAVNQPLYQTLINLIEDDDDYRANSGRHVDHQYADQQNKGAWKAYAPAWWLAGQDEGLSDIANADPFPQRWWHEGNHYWKLPFIKIPKGQESQWQNLVHTPDEAPPTERAEAILWLRKIARQAWDRCLLPSCPDSLNLPAHFWPGGFIAAGSDKAAIAHLADYPANGLFPHPFSNTNIL